MTAELPTPTRQLLDRVLGGSWSAVPLRGDASARLYWRVEEPGGRTAVVSYYPEQIRDGLSRALRAWEHLGDCAPLPALLGWDECGVVQEDVGERNLLSVLMENRELGVRLYGQAVDLLEVMQKAPAEGRSINPPFDAARFMTELEMTGAWYVEQLCGAPYTDELRREFEALCVALEDHPYLLCHRDYHGENLHVVGERLVMIDFQDLREGPDTYDLASLLRDRGVARVLGRDEELRLVDRWVKLRADDAIAARYHETLLQRTLKTLGTFARQAIERERSHYLDYIEPALESVDICAESQPRWAELAAALPRSWRRS